MDDVNVENLRAVAPNGETLQAVREHVVGVVLHVVFIGQSGQTMLVTPDNPCVYSVACNECLMGHEVEPDPRTGEPVSLGPCRRCNGTGVVEQVPDRLIGPGSEWADRRGARSWSMRSKWDTASAMRARGWTLVRAVPPTPEEPTDG